MKDYGTPQDQQIADLVGRAEAVTEELLAAGEEREAGLVHLFERLQVLTEENRGLAQKARHYYDQAQRAEGRAEALQGQVETLQGQVAQLTEMVSRTVQTLHTNAARMTADNRAIDRALTDNTPADVSDLVSSRREPVRPQVPAPAAIRTTAPAPFRAAPAPAASADDFDEGAAMSGVLGNFSSLAQPRAGVAA